MYWRTHSPNGNLLSSVYTATVFPEKRQQHTSLAAAEVDAALQLLSFPPLGRAASLLTEKGVEDSQKSLSRAQDLLCSREHRMEAKTELAIIQGQQHAPLTPPSGYQLCPISSEFDHERKIHSQSCSLAKSALAFDFPGCFCASPPTGPTLQEPFRRPASVPQAIFLC